MSCDGAALTCHRRCAVRMQGNEILEAYVHAVVGDMKALLDWKCNRARPGSGDRKR
jgi:hypothetical protein